MTHFATAAERAYPCPRNPTPDLCQHLATRDEYLRLERIRRDCARLAPQARREWDAMPKWMPPEAAALRPRSMKDARND